MISIVLPTLGERIYELERLFKSLLIQNYKNFEVILVAQDNFDDIKVLINRYSNSIDIKYIESEYKGLSVSRNIAMKNVNGEIVIFSDDDAWYFEDSLNIVKNEINEKDIICLEIMDPIIKEKYKNYRNHKSNVGKIQILKKSSIEICVNLNRVDKEKIVFDENFGLGSKNKSGEENIFLYNMLKLGKNIEYKSKVYIYHRKKKEINLSKEFIIDKFNLLQYLYGKKLGNIFASYIVLKNIKKFNIGNFEVIKNIGKCFF